MGAALVDKIKSALASEACSENVNTVRETEPSALVNRQTRVVGLVALRVTTAMMVASVCPTASVSGETNAAEAWRSAYARTRRAESARGSRNANDMSSVAGAERESSVDFLGGQASASGAIPNELVMASRASRTIAGRDNMKTEGSWIKTYADGAELRMASKLHPFNHAEKQRAEFSSPSPGRITFIRPAQVPKAENGPHRSINGFIR